MTMVRRLKAVQPPPSAVMAANKAFLIGLCASLIVALASVTVSYAEPPAPSAAVKNKPDPGNGLVLARKLCASCHLIGEPESGAVNADIPSFTSIANRPYQSVERLTGWLSAPHAPMPNPNLTRQEMADLSAYIMSMTAPK